jgi:hypothetical protein
MDQEKAHPMTTPQPDEANVTTLPVLVEEAVARLRRLSAGEEPYSADWATAIAEDTGMTPVEFDEETIAKWFVSHGANELLAAEQRATAAEAKLRAAEERAEKELIENTKLVRRLTTAELHEAEARAATKETTYRLHDAYQQLLYLWEHTRSCPCGARPESPNTHPHVTSCPTGRAVELFGELSPSQPAGAKEGT